MSLPGVALTTGKRMRRGAEAGFVSFHFFPLNYYPVPLGRVFSLDLFECNTIVVASDGSAARANTANYI